MYYSSLQVGDMVAEGQQLIVIEAMKMQNGLHAAKTGMVRRREREGGGGR